MTEADATLVVAWRTGKNTHARKVKASDEVIGHLLEVASQVEDVISNGAGGVYDPDDEQGDFEYLAVAREDLLDPGLEVEMLKGPSLPMISIADLERRSLAGYGLVVGAPGDRVVYLKRRSPVQMLRKSLITRFNEMLTTVEDPILAFDATFDVVLSGDDIWTLHQANFEALFKESDAVLAMADDWVNELAGKVPIQESSRAELAALVRKNSVLRRKLHSILRRGHIANLGTEELKKAIEDHSMDPTKLMPNGELEITPENAKQVLSLLNEDFWSGYFSQEGWSASRKSPR